MAAETKYFGYKFPSKKQLTEEQGNSEHGVGGVGGFR